VTERAYDIHFVEDLVRNVALKLNEHPMSWYKVEAENHETFIITMRMPVSRRGNRSPHRRLRRAEDLKISMDYCFPLIHSPTLNLDR